MLLCHLINRAWRDPRGRRRHVDELVMAIDEYKLQLQLGKELRAFAGFGQFQQLAEMSVSLDKQSGGWRWRQSARPQTPPR